MPTETDKKRLSEFRQIETNQSLAIFNFFRKVEVDIEIKFKMLEDKIASLIETKVKEYNPSLGGMTEKIIKNIVKDAKGDKGEEGPQGDRGSEGPPGRSIQGSEGKRGPEGPTGPQGVEGKSIVGPEGKPGPEGKQGPKGDPGSPDTPKEIKNKLERLKGEDRLSALAIKGLEEVTQKTILVGGDRGRREYRQTGIVLTGTINGTDGTDGNATFTFPAQFKSNTEAVYVGGIRQRRGASYQYTVANDRKSIVFNSGSIPVTGSEVIGDFDEDR